MDGAEKSFQVIPVAMCMICQARARRTFAGGARVRQRVASCGRLADEGNATSFLPPSCRFLSNSPEKQCVGDLMPLRSISGPLNSMAVIGECPCRLGQRWACPARAISRRRFPAPDDRYDERVYLGSRGARSQRAGKVFQGGPTGTFSIGMVTV